MANIIKLGSLLLDGVSTEPGAKFKPGQAIRFNDGNDLQWVIVNGLLIADRPLLVDISWDDLNGQKLVFGKQISLNDTQFLCRLLKGGISEDDENEWDAALNATEDENDLWNWEPAACWGQNGKHGSTKELRLTRGYSSAHYWYLDPPDSRTAIIGYRPVLELMPSEQLVCGDRICALGGQSVIYGTLLETTGYDAIVRPDPTSQMADVDIGNLCSVRPDGTIIIDRTFMVIQDVS